MGIYYMSDELIAWVATQARSGKSLQEIAAEKQISLEMAAAAARKWPLIERMMLTHAL